MQSQVAVLSKFLHAAQLCKEMRNYATCLAIADGLENIIIKQLPAWKNLPTKSYAVMEDLKSVRVRRLRVESGGKRKRRGGGVLYFLKIKNFLEPYCVLKAQGKTFYSCPRFANYVIHLSKGPRNIILPVLKKEYTAVKDLILDIIAMCFSDVSQE